MHPRRSTSPPRATCPPCSAQIDAVQPRLLIVDSVQTIAADEIDGTAGGVSQVRAVAAALTAVAKERNMACVLVGHVTKDGAIAGPRVLEHLVDVVLQFEGDRHSTLRTVRGVKNRYGPADEVGCFQMVPGRHRRAGRPVGPVPVRPAPPRCRAPARRSPCRAGGRCRSSCRRWSRQPRASQAGAPCLGLDSARAAMVIAVAAALGRRRAGRPGRARRDGRRRQDRRTGSRSGAGAWRSGRRRGTCRCPPGWWRSASSGWPATSARSPALDRRLAEAARLGFDRGDRARRRRAPARARACGWTRRRPDGGAAAAPSAEAAVIRCAADRLAGRRLARARLRCRTTGVRSAGRSRPLVAPDHGSEPGHARPADCLGTVTRIRS